MGYATGNQTSHWRCNVRTSVSYPNNSTANVNVQCIFQSCGWAHAINLARCTARCNGVDSIVASSVDNREYGSANWHETVVHSHTFAVSRGSGWTCKSEASIHNVSTYENGDSSAACSDNISATPAPPTPPPPSVTKPPAPSNVKLTRVDDTTLKGSWTFNGSGTSKETGVGVDIKIDDDPVKDEDCGILDGQGVVTSLTWTKAAPNHKYQMSVHPTNSAGSDPAAKVWSNIVYTTPAQPLAPANIWAYISDNGIWSLQLVENHSPIKYPGGTWELQYSNDKTNWTTLKKFTDTATGYAQFSDSEIPSTLKTYLTALKNRTGYVYFRTRRWCEDGSLASPYSSAGSAMYIKNYKAYVKASNQPIQTVTVMTANDTPIVRWTFYNASAIYVDKGFSFKDLAYLADKEEILYDPPQVDNIHRNLFKGVWSPHDTTLTKYPTLQWSAGVASEVKLRERYPITELTRWDSGDNRIKLEKFDDSADILDINTTGTPIDISRQYDPPKAVYVKSNMNTTPPKLFVKI